MCVCVTLSYHEVCAMFVCGCHASVYCVCVVAVSLMPCVFELGT